MVTQYAAESACYTSQDSQCALSINQQKYINPETGGDRPALLPHALVNIIYAQHPLDKAGLM